MDSFYKNLTFTSSEIRHFFFMTITSNSYFVDLKKCHIALSIMCLLDTVGTPGHNAKQIALQFSHYYAIKTINYHVFKKMELN